jgi:hypothetical protein
MYHAGRLLPLIAVCHVSPQAALSHPTLFGAGGNVRVKMRTALVGLRIGCGKIQPLHLFGDKTIMRQTRKSRGSLTLMFLLKKVVELVVTYGDLQVRVDNEAVKGVRWNGGGSGLPSAILHVITGKIPYLGIRNVGYITVQGGFSCFEQWICQACVTSIADN